MTLEAKNKFSDLVWTFELPTVSGHYFIACEHFDRLYEWIDVSDGEVFNIDRDGDKSVYLKEHGYQFFGPLEIPPPPVAEVLT